MSLSLALPATPKPTADDVFLAACFVCKALLSVVAAAFFNSLVLESYLLDYFPFPETEAPLLDEIRNISNS